MAGHAVTGVDDNDTGDDLSPRVVADAGTRGRGRRVGDEHEAQPTGPALPAPDAPPLPLTKGLRQGQHGLPHSRVLQVRKAVVWAELFGGNNSRSRVNDVAL